jgi:hypothetical protein
MISLAHAHPGLSDRSSAVTATMSPNVAVRGPVSGHWTWSRIGNWETSRP